MMNNTPFGADDMMMGWGTGYSGPLIMLAIAALIILAVFAIFKPQTPHQLDQPSPEHSIIILKERLARGEIDEKEYEVKRRYLDRE